MDRSPLAAPASNRRISAHRFRKRAAVLAGILALSGFASPAMGSQDASTRLVRCGAESCLLVTGHRDDPSAIVSINGQVVNVEGRRGWKVSVPVATVREWSAPYAREIEVSLRDPATQQETAASVDLPIGLLGGVTELAALEVSVP